MPLSTIFQLYRENHRPAADHSLRCALKKITKLKTGIKLDENKKVQNWIWHFFFSRVYLWKPSEREEMFLHTTWTLKHNEKRKHVPKLDGKSNSINFSNMKKKLP